MKHNLDRRTFLRCLGALGATLNLPTTSDAAVDTQAITKKAIPVSGETLPVVGMGTWITFDAGDDQGARARLRPVLQAFFDHGGSLIDSSPMYGSSEEVLGDLLQQVAHRQPLFAATKVWTPGHWIGIKQMEASQRLWGVTRFDLMQIHNMLDWETHLETLKAWKAEGRIRYVGITTSHGRRHEAMEQVMRTQPFDFVQFTYNLADREAEQRLLPLAAERRIAVIANRPLQAGTLFKRVKGKALPSWAQDFDCANWAQFFLKFVVSHPAVTCAIPATSKPEHMVENMGAGFGRLPDATTRARMARYWDSL
jgi:aryl-alcohol dehydrogenase-like predicted oxidoreductase